MKKLLNWRKSSKAVALGKLIHYPVTNGIYVYFRVYQEYRIMVLLNNKEHEQVLNLDIYSEMFSNKSHGIDILNKDKYNLSKELKIKPKTALILELE